jgi:creatinine amidohydrolase/Fe(II)-dependent formamide hydrolase-like protein
MGKTARFSHWCWERGEQGNTKIDPSTVIELMPMFGREDGPEMPTKQDAYCAEVVAEKIL